MEVPERIRQQLGDETLESAVNLGDEDLICFSPTRTFLYRGERLLSDESLEVYDHDVERLDVSEGRRKTSFTLTYIDREERFTVPRGRTEPVLERLLGGILETASVIDSDESVEGVFQFSELTLIITEKRLVKHIGRYLWDQDYEEFSYENVTGLEFEEGSVATYIVLSVDGRPQRIKAPRGEAAIVRRTLTTALCAYYDVDSLEQLHDTVGETDTDDDVSHSSGIELDDSIAPLVTPDDDDADKVSDEFEPLEKSAETAVESGPSTENPTTASSSVDTGTAWSSEDSTTIESSEDAITTESQEDTITTESSESATTTEAVDRITTETTTGLTESEAETPLSETTDTTAVDSAESAAVVDPEEIEIMKTRLATLTKVVKQQNELLERQDERIAQLIDELRDRERQQ